MRLSSIKSFTSGLEFTAIHCAVSETFGESFVVCESTLAAVTKVIRTAANLINLRFFIFFNCELIHRMERRLISFGIDEDCEITHFFTNLRFGNDNVAAMFFNSIQNHLKVFAAVEIDRGAIA